MRVLDRLKKAVLCQTEMCQKAADSQGESSIKDLRQFVKEMEEDKQEQLAEVSH